MCNALRRAEDAAAEGSRKGNTAHFTLTETGTFFAEAVNAELVYDPETDENTPVPADPTVDPTKPTYEGRYTVWGGYNGNRNNEASTFTFSAAGRGSDGSSIQRQQRVSRFAIRDWRRERLRAR